MSRVAVCMLLSDLEVSPELFWYLLQATLVQLRVPHATCHRLGVTSAQTLTVHFLQPLTNVGTYYQHNLDIPGCETYRLTRDFATSVRL